MRDISSRPCLPPKLRDDSDEERSSPSTGIASKERPGPVAAEDTWYAKCQRGPRDPFNAKRTRENDKVEEFTLQRSCKELKDEVLVGTDERSGRRDSAQPFHTKIMRDNEKLRNHPFACYRASAAVSRISCRAVNTDEIASCRQYWGVWSCQRENHVRSAVKWPGVRQPPAAASRLSRVRGGRLAQSTSPPLRHRPPALASVCVGRAAWQHAWSTSSTGPSNASRNLSGGGQDAGPLLLDVMWFFAARAMDAGSPSKSIVGDAELNYRAANYIDSLYTPEEYSKATAVKQPTRKRVHTFQRELAGLGTAPPEHSKDGLVPPSGDVPFNLGAPPSLLRLVDLSSPSTTSMGGEPSIAKDTPQPEAQGTAVPVPSLVPSAMGAQNTEANTQEDEEETEEDSEEEDSMARLLPTAYTCAHCHIHTDPSRRSRSHRSKLLNSAIICGVCSLYEHTHGRVRPFAHESSAERPAAVKSTPRKVEQCSNCGSRRARSMKGRERHWYRSKLGTKGRLCNACYLYEWMNNQPRPQVLIERAQARQPTFLTSTNENRIGDSKIALALVILTDPGARMKEIVLRRIRAKRNPSLCRESRLGVLTMREGVKLIWGRFG
ncbi:hypothetical protein FB451DRAFT_1175845 [Mycena latifolia]|nr:hypothetical protein FB451DRAFT_1175845 [Mycena latifolia]